jgi:hypothetical protein
VGITNKLISTDVFRFCPGFPFAWVHEALGFVIVTINFIQVLVNTVHVVCIVAVR